MPKSVRKIGDSIFNCCRNLRSLTFEKGSKLAHVGEDITYGTPLAEKEVEFPKTARFNHSED